MSPDQTSPYMTVEETASYLRLTKKTLENYRNTGYGPFFRKHGGKVLYHKDDIEAWSNKTKRRSTAGERQ